MDQATGRAGRVRGGKVTRREALLAGGLGAAGLGLAWPGGLSAATGRSDRAVIWLSLVGGPSQLESFDPKPDAPAEVRGPFGSIATRIPGVRFSEHLPELARRADRLALVRSVHHHEAPIHETGLQLLQTGRIARAGAEAPHFGALATAALPGSPRAVVLPGPVGSTGVGISQGQTAGVLGPDAAPWSPGDPSDRLSRALRNALRVEGEPESVAEAYGPTPFGRDCLRARRLVEAGARSVVVNMGQTVFNRVSWDAHGASPFSTLDDYRRTLLPDLDAALSALLDDLDRRGRLGSTLVVATGEFGRTPKLNVHGGRDHWPGVWTAVFAGGGVRGGTVLGATDARAAEPADRPVVASEVFATVAAFLGLDTAGTVLDAEGRPVGVMPEGVRPLGELFG